MTERRYAAEAFHFTVAVFVVQQGHVLLHLHARTGLWLPPGGHIEPGELPDEAALREVMEEAGIAVRLVGRTGIDHHADDAPRQLARPEGIQLEDISPEHQHIDLIYFAVPEDAGPDGSLPALGGEGGMRWVDEGGLAELPLTDEVAAWVGRALAEIPGRVAAGSEL
ncbi:NUDIX hydrolase [Ornithinimicrobium panacihumi]|uniref:NUDIX hydrolase n=1 Tax=Ornithinimicrobium panacihumi TaxID=2008449 RepID=UPI003F8AB43B